MREPVKGGPGQHRVKERGRPEQLRLVPVPSPEFLERMRFKAPLRTRGRKLSLLQESRQEPVSRPPLRVDIELLVDAVTAGPLTSADHGFAALSWFENDTVSPLNFEP